MKHEATWAPRPFAEPADTRLPDLCRASEHLQSAANLLRHHGADELADAVFELARQTMNSIPETREGLS